MKMGPPDSSNRLSNFRSASGVGQAQQRQQHLACDRCRGQKLRCIRTSNLHASCQRCQNAGATCVTDPSVRMGRPQRSDKDRRKATNNSHKSQPKHPPNSPNSRQSPSPTSSKNFTTNSNVWTGPDLEESIDSNLMDAQNQNSLDFELHHVELDNEQTCISPSQNSFDNVFDLFSPHVPQNLDDFGAFGFGTEGTTVSLQEFPFVSIEPVTIDQTTARQPKDEENPKLQARVVSIPTPQEAVEKVSNLNLELHRQLSIIGRKEE
ncbi:uncharacterized protein LY89DRAFT_443733 [Mollisia scopiformis]|uniref:Zn(2)-C6 fungal-type domain-containing protein n=1 Tax=Mollisia scopiformis TaxID=149040 RepID=A0A194XJX7_MOLSC|nr:uncharacterized protein LY89DRAFT_443733 [Mollisia scopiformis]KUJ20441.1 hypothetical protein LY89DRAFT_443733 [Mollisia scopiformis]